MSESAAIEDLMAVDCAPVRSLGSNRVSPRLLPAGRKGFTGFARRSHQPLPASALARGGLVAGGVAATDQLTKAGANVLGNPRRPTVTSPLSAWPVAPSP